jgi:CRP-like cAMP-binding protein
MVLSPYYDTLSKRTDFVRELPLFAELSEADLATLISEFQLREYEKEETIFHQGDDSRELYIVLNGKIRIYKTSPSGNETSIQIFFPGDVVDMMCSLDRSVIYTVFVLLVCFSSPYPASERTILLKT